MTRTGPLNGLPIACTLTVGFDSRLCGLSLLVRRAMASMWTSTSTMG